MKALIVIRSETIECEIPAAPSVGDAIEIHNRARIGKERVYALHWVLKKRNGAGVFAHLRIDCTEPQRRRGNPGRPLVK